MDHLPHIPDTSKPPLSSDRRLLRIINLITDEIEHGPHCTEERVRLAMVRNYFDDLYSTPPTRELDDEPAPPSIYRFPRLLELRDALKVPVVVDLNGEDF